MAEAIAQRPPARSSGRMYLVLATGFAILAGLLAFAALRDSGGSSSSPASVATLNRVVAAEDIPARTRVTEDMLTVQAIPTDAALVNAFAAPESVIGLVTRHPDRRERADRSAEGRRDDRGRRRSRQRAELRDPHGFPGGRDLGHGIERRWRADRRR